MISIMGVGKMGSAIAAGLIANGQGEDLVLVVRPGSDTSVIAERFPDVRIEEKPVACDGAVIAVKPKDVAIAASDAAQAGAKRILSVAAGITLSALHDAAGGKIPVLRSMPNVGAQVQQSATAVCASAAATEDDLLWAESVLEPLGTVVRVAEAQMDAVTGLSGSGIAFVLLVLESLIDAGVSAGVDAVTARNLAIATVQGAGALAAAGDEPIAALRGKITTPAGTTVAGLRVLEQRAVRAAFIDAVAASAERSSEIGKLPH